MARIIYGVAGEGSGHASRSKILIEHLLKNGHEVKIVSHDKGYDNLSPYFDVLKISGLRMTYKHNQLHYVETLFNNLIKLPGLQRSFKKIRDLIENFQPHLVISDFEPLTALVAHLNNIPLLSIDNQHQLTNTKLSYPRGYLEEALLAKTVSRLMVYRTKAYLVTSFFKTPITHPRTYLFPPILRQEVLDAQPYKEDFVLIYVNSNFSDLVSVLEKIDRQFIVYGISSHKKIKNIIFKKPSQIGFLEDLSHCQAVIATAGLSLISEALYLGKPYLAIPVKHQFEQILNAYYLEKLGYGKFLKEITKEGIESFLSDLSYYEKNLLKYERSNNQQIFNKLDSLIKKYSS